MTCQRLFPTFVLVSFALLCMRVIAEENPRNNPNQRVGGPFENAEYFYYGMPERIDSTHTSVGWESGGQKLILTGTVYNRDGKIPAEGIVLYYYHTNSDGYYAGGSGADPRAIRHGHLRGWVKSDANGKYTIRTIRPAPYPNEKIPAHIHFAVKEPQLNEYYVDDVVFDDDPLLTQDLRKAMENRCGSGIVQLKKSGDTLVAERDFILGMNIPDHPPKADFADDNASTAKLNVPEAVVDGFNPGIAVSGLNRQEVVRIHVLRSLAKWKESGGQWQSARQSLHAFADFAANAYGRIEVDTQAPIVGTYTTADPLALLRTGYGIGDPTLKDFISFPEEPLIAGPENRVWVKLERDGKIEAEAFFELSGEAKGLEVGQKSGEGWHAVYARPDGGDKLPVVISLHGSEGGSIDKARGRACQFANNGFAAVGVNYFAYPHEAIPGVPIEHAEIKLEILESIRDWLKTRPEVDANRIHLVGVSKGAEFALLAATRFDWIASVVAVVPSDVVWQGYSANGGTGTTNSSWSIGGKAVPFIPLFQFESAREGMYRTNTERYTRSRKFYLYQETAARILVENVNTRILLLASDRDEVWASGDMARNIVERMVSAGKGEKVEVRIYPKAGHQLAGTGTFPVRLYGEQSSDPTAKDILDEGDAAADAWRRTIRFLKK